MPGADKPLNWLTLLLLCIFVGGAGIHRFYAGKIATGKFTDKNGNVVQKA